jgi:RNA polymerase sigma-70 factor (ECF subfamily)
VETEVTLPEPALISSTVVTNAAAGDHAAFTELVSTYHHDMLRLALVITGDHDLADDAVQAAWHRAWHKLRQLREPARVRAWLLTIAANEARQALRRRARLVRMPPELSEAPPMRDRIDALDLARALSQLKPEDRVLVGLRYVSGFSAPELAIELGISAEGVRSRLKRILDRLRLELGE